jgi:hypothetical protein
VHNLAQYNVHAPRAWRRLTAPAAAHHGLANKRRAWTRYISTDIIQPTAWRRCQVFGEEPLTIFSLIAVSIFEVCVERMFNLRFKQL